MPVESFAFKEVMGGEPTGMIRIEHRASRLLAGIRRHFPAGRLWRCRGDEAVACRATLDGARHGAARLDLDARWRVRAADGCSMAAGLTGSLNHFRTGNSIHPTHWTLVSLQA